MQLVTAEDLKLAASCFVLAGIFLLLGAAFFSWCGWLAIQKEQKVITAWKKRQKQGFSLIELLLVITIILVIAAIAIPSLLSSQQRARAASAVGSLKAIGSAETSYMLTYQTYSPSLAVLGNSSDPTCTPLPTSTCQIDVILAGGTKAGYVFTYLQLASGQDYSINADPANGQSGTHFYVDSTGVIRFDPASANSSSPVLQ